MSKPTAKPTTAALEHGEWEWVLYTYTDAGDIVDEHIFETKQQAVAFARYIGTPIVDSWEMR